jgi:hypothetical protein
MSERKMCALILYPKEMNIKVPVIEKTNLYSTKRILAVLGIVTILLFLFFIFASTVSCTKKSTVQSTIQETTQKNHIVKQFDTLWGISWCYYDNCEYWPTIYFANSNVITFPDLIITGTNLVINQLYSNSTWFGIVLSEQYFTLYQMYLKKGWKRHAEGMLYIAVKLDRNIIEKQSTNLQFIKNYRNLMNGRVFQ